jgi:drug/metabolite transporter (DMT)-like permease
MSELESPELRPKRFIDSYWSFFVAAALVGPFALPVLWRNPRFSKRSKWALTLLVLAVTAFLIWFTGYVAMESVDRITNFDMPS